MMAQSPQQPQYKGICSMENNTLSHPLMKCLTAVTLCLGMPTPTFSVEAETLFDENEDQLHTIYLDGYLVEQVDASGQEPMRAADDPRNAEDWRVRYSGIWVKHYTKLKDIGLGIHGLLLTLETD